VPAKTFGLCRHLRFLLYWETELEYHLSTDTLCHPELDLGSVLHLEFRLYRFPIGSGMTREKKWKNTPLLYLLPVKVLG